MADTAASLPLPSSSTPARIELVHLGEQRLVMLNGHPIGQYRQDDRGTERVLMTQLAEAMTMKDADIALAFGVHPVTLSRYLSQARSGGAAALIPAPRRPRPPVKLKGGKSGPP